MRALIRRLVKEYDGKWEINKWSNLPNKGAYFVTPVISPITSENVKFFFELKWDFFRTLSNSGPMVSNLEIRIFREILSLRGNKKSASRPLEMEAVFTIIYSDGRLLRECKNPFPVNVNNLFNCCFDRSRFELLMLDKDDPLYFTEHCRRLKNNNLTLTCHLKFYDYAPPQELILLKNLQVFSRTISSMYEKNVLPDFEFKIGHKKLSAHKAVLAAHSPVLEKMVSADFIESKTNSAVITDCKYETFESFLRYLYSGEIITPTWRDVLDLYVLADKYDVSVLKERCADILIDSLNVDRISKVLKVAFTYRDFRLIQETKKFCAELPSD